MCRNSNYLTDWNISGAIYKSHRSHLKGGITAWKQFLIFILHMMFNVFLGEFPPGENSLSINSFTVEQQ